MFKNKKKDPIRFGRTVAKAKEVEESSVTSESTPAPIQPVSVVIEKRGGDNRQPRKTILGGAMSATGSTVDKLWHMLLDIIGLVFIVGMIWIVASLLQAAGVINLPILDPLSKFFQSSFLKMFFFVVPAGTTPAQ